MYDMFKDLPYEQYIWNGVLEDVEEYMNSIPDGETVDIRRCRFDPLCIKVVMNHIGRLNIINSEEPELDYILKFNKSVATMDKSKVERRNIKAKFYDVDGKRIEDFMKEIVESSKSVVWKIPKDAISSKYLNNYITVMLGLVMQFPKRQFDISSTAPAEFAKTAKEYFNIEDYLNYDYVYFTLGGGAFMRWKFDDPSTGSLHIGGIGNISLEKLINVYNALPGWLGVEKVIGTEREAILDKVYANVKFADRIEANGDITTIRGYITKYGGL